MPAAVPKAGLECSGADAPGGATAAPASPPEAKALLTALQRNWRKVASTDNLLLLAEEAGAEQQQSDHTASRSLLLKGIALIGLGVALLAWALFALVAARLMPLSSVNAIAAIQQDWYYCFLGPLLLPVTVIAVTANWFSLKLFKHNS